jgi:hypothetical protein
MSPSRPFGCILPRLRFLRSTRCSRSHTLTGKCRSKAASDASCASPCQHHMKGTRSLRVTQQVWWWHNISLPSCQNRIHDLQRLTVIFVTPVFYWRPLVRRVRKLALHAPIHTRHSRDTNTRSTACRRCARCAPEVGA